MESVSGSSACKAVVIVCLLSTLDGFANQLHENRFTSVTSSKHCGVLHGARLSSCPFISVTHMGARFGWCYERFSRSVVGLSSEYRTTKTALACVSLASVDVSNAHEVGVVDTSLVKLV